MATRRIDRIAQDQNFDASDALSVVKAMLVGLDPQESATFRDQLLELLSAEEQPEAPDKRPPGADRRLARDTALPRGTPSFAERFPNAAKVRPEGGAFDRRYHR